MLTRVKHGLFVLAAVVIGATTASAAPLVGTGVPGPAGTQELNWTVLPIISSRDLYVVNGAADYPTAWVNAAANNLTAKWISPYADVVGNTLATDDPNAHSAFVDYTYTLAGFSNPGANVTIKWATDNGAQFFLNGVLLNTIAAPNVNDQPFAALTTFTILASQFAVGANTFTAIVRNLAYDAGPNPTGLLVNTSVSPVPLPPAMLLFGSALVGMNWLRKRRPERNSGVAMDLTRA
jgi:hypothetical protein